MKALAVRAVNTPSVSLVVMALADDIAKFLREETQMETYCPELLKEAEQAIEAHQLRKAAELLNCAESEDDGTYTKRIEVAWNLYYDARR